MNEPKARLLKISVAVLVIFTLVTVLIVYAANIDGLDTGDWTPAVDLQHTDAPGDAPPNIDITDVYAHWGVNGQAYFRLDVSGPPPPAAIPTRWDCYQ